MLLVIEWAIDHRQSMMKDNDLLDRDHYRLNLNEIHQLRQGKAYLELITDMLYGTRVVRNRSRNS